MTSLINRDVCNAITFDVEDWYHGFGLTADDITAQTDRLHVGLAVILEILARHSVRATFFVLGELVEKSEPLLREIADAGHEIAVHGFRHVPVFELTPEQFACDLGRAKQALQSLTDEPVIGFRAPFFSITEASLWALPILADCGFRYDASIVPARNPRYGIPDSPHLPYALADGLDKPVPAAESLTEYPVSTTRIGNTRIPFGGGFYARFFPYKLLHHWVKQSNRNGDPTIFYFHPWEFDPDHPRIRGNLSRLYVFTHYHRLSSTAITLDALLRDFSFGAIADLYLFEVARTV